MEYDQYDASKYPKKYGTVIHDINSLLYAHKTINMPDLINFILTCIAKHNRYGTNIVIFDDPCTRDMNPRKAEMCASRDAGTPKYEKPELSGFTTDPNCDLVSLYRRTPGGRKYVQECLKCEFEKIMNVYETEYDRMVENMVIYINGQWLVGENCKDVYGNINSVIFEKERKAEADNIIPLLVTYWADAVALINPLAHLEIISIDSDILLTLYSVLCRRDMQDFVLSDRLRWIRPGKEQGNRVVRLCDTLHYKNIMLSVNNVTSYIVALMGGSDINKQYVVSISLLVALCKSRPIDYDDLFIYTRSGSDITIECKMKKLFDYFRYRKNGVDGRKISNERNIKSAQTKYEYKYKDATYEVFPTFGHLLDVVIAFMYYCVNVGYNETIKALKLSGDEILQWNKDYYRNPIDVINIKLSLSD